MKEGKMEEHEEEPEVKDENKGEGKRQAPKA